MNGVKRRPTTEAVDGAPHLDVREEARGAIAEPLRELLIDGFVAALVADFECRRVLQRDEPAGAGR